MKHNISEHSYSCNLTNILIVQNGSRAIGDYSTGFSTRQVTHTWLCVNLKRKVPASTYSVTIQV